MLWFCRSILESGGYGEPHKQFLLHYAKFALAQAEQYIKKREDAEDVAQDVLTYALEHLERLPVDDERKTRRYIDLCIRSRAVDLYRKGSRYSDASEEDVESIPDHTGSPEHILIRAEAFEKVLDAITRLPEKYRIPMELSKDGFSPDEIGSMLDIPRDTVYKRLQRGRKILIERMREIYE